MNNKKNKVSNSLKGLFAATTVLFAIFLIAFFVFGALAGNTADADIKGGIGDVFKYHFHDIKGLFTFNFMKASNVIYLSLSGLLYFILFITIICLTIGILASIKKKRLVIIPSLAYSFVALFVFFILATGLPKYWAIINKRGSFVDDSSLLGPTFLLLIFGFLYFLCAYVFYFFSLLETLKRGNVPMINEEKEEDDDPSLPKEEVMFEVVNLFNEEKKKEPEQNDKEDSQAQLKEMIRDIVREELARNNANQAANNGPLVVQYFTGDNQEGKLMSQQVKVPSQVVQKKVEKPVPIAQPAEEENKNPIIRIPFQERMLNADKEMQSNYNELKNEILSYGVNFRVSNSGDTFRLHRKTYVKITIAGLSLKLYFALNPNDYKDSTIPVQDAGHKGIYEEIPLVFKVKSGLSMRRCKELIQDVMEKNGLEQGEVANIDWVKELKKL